MKNIYTNEKWDARESKEIQYKPNKKCDSSTNRHKEIMSGCKLPCIHTVTEEDEIIIKYQELDEDNFIISTDYQPCQSPLTGKLKQYTDDDNGGSYIE